MLVLDAVQERAWWSQTKLCCADRLYLIILKSLLWILLEQLFQKLLDCFLSLFKILSRYFISAQARGYQRWGLCWPVLKCLITCLSLICLPSSWALSAHWQLAALFSWAKWWEMSQYTCLSCKICSYSLKWHIMQFCYIVKTVLCICLLPSGSICASLHHGWSLPKQTLHSYTSQ